MARVAHSLTLQHRTPCAMRRYGERSPSGDQPIFVERKVHRDRYTGELR